MLSRFIVVEGANGAGKTYTTCVLADILRANDYRVFQTKQPSAAFMSEKEENFLKGRELLDTLIQDRYSHIKEVVEPTLHTYDFVVCDRYIASTLVYQRIDGLNFYELWEKNKSFPTPFLTIFLNPSEATTSNRLEQREYLTRFEDPNLREMERLYYKETMDFLRFQGHPIMEIEKLEPQIDEVLHRLTS